MVLVSKKNLQEALGKDYTKEKVEEIMRVRITYNAFSHSILEVRLIFWYVTSDISSQFLLQGLRYK